jgi:hypothetical protein
MIGLVLTALALFFFFNEGRRHLSIFFLFAVLTAGFQLVPVELMLLPGITKSYDWLLVFFMVLCIVKPDFLLSVKKWKEFKHIRWLLFVMLFLFFYSTLYEGIETPVAVRVFRNFIFIIFIFVFATLELEGINKVFRLIIYATTIASILYCAQAVIGVSILNNISDDYTPVDLQINNGIGRFYNTPAFVLPVFFLLAFHQSLVSSKQRVWLILPNVMAIVFSQHRNMIIGVIICAILYYIITKRVTLSKAIFAGVAAFIVLLTIDWFTGNRLTEGFTDMEDMLSNGLSTKDMLYTNLADMSTSEFRFYHFYERWSYITKDVVHSLFGLGFVTEDSHVVKALNFSIGLTDNDGKIVQVATSDIVWTLFMIHFGIIGTLVFLSVYINMLKRFFQFRQDKLMLTGLLFVVCLLFTSFYGIIIVLPSTLCILMLFLAYQYKLKLQASHSN